MPSPYIQLFSIFLSLVAKNVTPAISAALHEEIKTFQARCYATPNAWDDALAAALEPLLLLFPCDRC